MIIYNVTVKVDPEIHEEWVDWMKSVHIADVMKTGMFIEQKMLRLLGQDESQGITYAFQYTCESMEKLEEYNSKYATALKKDVTDRYPDKFVAFRTLLEII